MSAAAKERSVWIALAVAFLIAPGRASAQSADSVVSPRQLVAEGNELLEQDKYREALDKYEAAQKASPESAEVAYNRGIALYRLGRHDDAAAAFQDAIKPDNRRLEARAKYNLGRCAQAAGMEKAAAQEEAAINDLSNAVRFYDDALTLRPGEPDAAANKAHAERLIRFLEKRLKQKKKQEQEPEPSSQPSSRPTSQPDRQPSSQPTSQPSPTSQPQQQDQDRDQQDPNQQDQQQQQQQGEPKDGEPQGDPSKNEAKPDADEQRKMTPEQAERFLQQARDAERQRREQQRQRAIRLRGRIPVKKDW